MTFLKKFHFMPKIFDDFF